MTTTAEAAAGAVAVPRPKRRLGLPRPAAVLVALPGMPWLGGSSETPRAYPPPAGPPPAVASVLPPYTVRRRFDSRPSMALCSTLFELPTHAKGCSTLLRRTSGTLRPQRPLSLRRRNRRHGHTLPPKGERAERGYACCLQRCCMQCVVA